MFVVCERKLQCRCFNYCHVGVAKDLFVCSRLYVSVQATPENQMNKGIILCYLICDSAFKRGN